MDSQLLATLRKLAPMKRTFIHLSIVALTTALGSYFTVPSATWVGYMSPETRNEILGKLIAVSPPVYIAIFFISSLATVAAAAIRKSGWAFLGVTLLAVATPVTGLAMKVGSALCEQQGEPLGCVILVNWGLWQICFFIWFVACAMIIWRMVRTEKSVKEAV